MRRISKVDSVNAFVLPAFAKLVFIVEQTQLLNDVVHNKVDIDSWFVCTDLLVGFTQLTYLIDVEPLVRIQFQHAINNSSQFYRVLLRKRWNLSLCDSLEQIVKRQVFFVAGSKGTAKHAQFVSDASERPDVTFPVVTLSLKHFRTHIKWCSHSRKGFEGLRSQLTTKPEISHF